MADPGGHRQLGRLRTIALESNWVGRDGRVQCFGTLHEQGLSLTVMARSRRHVADARMTVAVVVPGEAPLAVGTSIFGTTEALREVRTVFERLV